MTVDFVEIVGIFLAIIFAITMYYHGYMILHEKDGYKQNDHKRDIARMRKRIEELMRNDSHD
tara:strand:- start:400 stop:585 length:186 start_codon:yes stop_codon:yes gene_type:complete